MARRRYTDTVLISFVRMIRRWALPVSITLTAGAWAVSYLLPIKCTSLEREFELGRGRVSYESGLHALYMFPEDPPPAPRWTFGRSDFDKNYVDRGCRGPGPATIE